ncbi:BNR repeat-containing protein [Solwaraspora sp. WMMD1047]|uniref:BNR repeat-containing protein n=1 Tax=Solwaraspora sp. WMMD1047 TaxID=3016102 RepID=UPI0024175D63|nr:BNR repeat-containing protein [Solwaraspora sp. WMMD1047]MDG4830930.1 BNR repeat-containing protein [Solwaraspora sp. WMMD1047]
MTNVDRSAPPAGISPNGAGAPPVARLDDTRLDRTALYFVSYDGLVNTASYQQSGILTWAGHQYAAWYTASRQVVLARRPVGSGIAGDWQRLALPHSLSTYDSHNTISLGVSPADGRLHVAMDTHDTPVHYVRSEAGLVADPARRDWRATRFGRVHRDLDGADLGGISYPRFLAAPDGRLQLSYRTGHSSNGRMELAEYHDGRWNLLGPWTSATGTYAANGATSTTRNLYLHGLTYDGTGRLHAAFTWRERTAVLGDPGGLANHDTGYAYSDDTGRTWRNNAGEPVATTGGPTLLSLTSPGHVVDPLGVDHALINQESQAVDSTGQPHVVISYVPARFTPCVTSFVAQRRSHGRIFHLRREPAGTWHKTEIPVPLNAFGRTRIVLDAADNAYLVLPYGRIVAASRASGWTDWALRFDGAGLNAFGEVVVDEHRVRSQGVLSVLYQQRSTGTRPSPLRVADFRLG